MWMLVLHFSGILALVVKLVGVSLAGGGLKDGRRDEGKGWKRRKCKG